LIRKITRNNNEINNACNGFRKVVGRVRRKESQREVREKKIKEKEVSLRHYSGKVAILGKDMN